MKETFYLVIVCKRKSKEEEIFEIRRCKEESGWTSRFNAKLYSKIFLEFLTNVKPCKASIVREKKFHLSSERYNWREKCKSAFSLEKPKTQQVSNRGFYFLFLFFFVDVI